MNRFLYTAKDRSGQDVSGILVAQSEELAVAQLQDAGHFVTTITQQVQTPPRVVKPSALERAFRGVNSGDLAIMFRELATMIGAGMTLVRALDVLEQNTSKPYLRQVLRDVQRGVEQGQALSQQMRRHGDVFPEIASATVEAAERSGRLDEMFKMLARYMEYAHGLRQTIRRETFYPKIVAVVIVLVLLLLVGLSVWRAGGSWLLATITLLAEVVAVIALLWLVVWILRSSPYARQVWDTVKLALPVVGKTVGRLVMSRFTRALAAMYEAGLSLPEGVRLSARACGNHHIANSLQACTFRMQHGMKLSEALAATGVVPNIVLQMVVTGEESGQLGTTLSKVADYYEDEAKTAIHAMCVSILPIAVGILGVVVLIIAITFYAGYFTSVLTVG